MQCLLPGVLSLFAGPLKFKRSREKERKRWRENDGNLSLPGRANILCRAIHNQRYLRPSTSPCLEISEQILSFVLRGGRNEAWGEQASAKLRVICAADDEQTWQIRRQGRRSDEKRRPLGLIKIFRTLALLIISTRVFFRFLLLNTKRTQQEREVCVLIILIMNSIRARMKRTKNESKSTRTHWRLK